MSDGGAPLSPAKTLARWTAAAIVAALTAAAFGQTTSTAPTPSTSLGAGTTRATTQPSPTTGPVGGVIEGGQLATRPAVKTIELSVSEAILRALENNKALIVQRFNPDLREEAVELQKAVFDPDLTAAFSVSRSRTDDGDSDTVAKSLDAQIGYGQFFPTGTDVAITAGTDATLGPDDYTSSLALTVTQSLLRGFGTAVNLASLRQARVDVLSSQYELRGVAQTLVSDTEKAYWDYALTRQQTEIAIQSLKIAEDQLTDTSERIRVGKLSPTQLAAAQAEVALRKQNLIDARSAEDKALLRLLRLVSPNGQATYHHQVILRDQPVPVKVALGSEDLHVQAAMRQRPDLNQARLQINRNDLEIVKTRNGLLPKMDVFISLGKTGYANSFGPSVDDLVTGNSYDVQVGMELEYPPLNRSARATHRRAVITRDQAIASLDNLAQLAELDVRTGYLEVVRTLEQVTASAATRRFQEETLRVEIESFRVGRSTSLLLAQAQRDLFSAKNAEVQAVANYLKALVDLYRLDGSLLERRGIYSPGWAPVELKLPPR